MLTLGGLERLGKGAERGSRLPRLLGDLPNAPCEAPSRWKRLEAFDSGQWALGHLWVRGLPRLCDRRDRRSHDKDGVCKAIPETLAQSFETSHDAKQESTKPARRQPIFGEVLFASVHAHIEAYAYLILFGGGGLTEWCLFFATPAKQIRGPETAEAIATNTP